MNEIFNKANQFLMNDLYSGFLKLLLPVGAVVIVTMALWALWSNNEHGMSQVKSKIIIVIIVIIIGYSARPIVTGLQSAFS
ncbi:hypothetical protein [Bacillus paramycoides]|uniref:hypothetical protein n=1 Tax=Bacillus paramycoides TaxID=2026194 RepID=UPI002E1E66BD|nr:hypothetical protein [Bacillus paramycoides]